MEIPSGYRSSILDRWLVLERENEDDLLDYLVFDTRDLKKKPLEIKHRELQVVSVDKNFLFIENWIASSPTLQVYNLDSGKSVSIYTSFKEVQYATKTLVCGREKDCSTLYTWDWDSEPPKLVALKKVETPLPTLVPKYFFHSALPFFTVIEISSSFNANENLSRKILIYSKKDKALVLELDVSSRPLFSRRSKFSNLPKDRKR